MGFIKNINIFGGFSLFCLAFILFGWLAFLLALTGLFYSLILGIFLSLELIFLIYLVILNRKKIKFSWDLFLATFLAIILIIALAYFTVPTVFSGRDQGSFSNAAINLSKNHNLKNSFPAEQEFFKIYGQGVALNFPGFSYDTNGNLVPNFFLGYIAWLAAFFSFFGINGFIFANSISFFIFLLSFYFLARNYLKKTESLAALLLIASSFIFSWFFKFTLSENLTLALLWFGLLQFIWFLKTKEKLFLISFLASFGLLIFVRIEGLAFLIMTVIILFLLGKTSNQNKKIFLKYVLPFLLLILIVFLISFFTSRPSYVSLAKGFLNSFNISQNESGASTGILGFLKENIYLLQVFTLYALLIYFVFGLIGLIYFFKKKRFDLLLPFFILLPAFFYLINPSITPDHPWMLRRYVFAAVPVSILYTVLFLKNFLKKNIGFYLLFLILFFSNLIVFIPNFRSKENSTLLTQIKQISENFGNSDLILIDREATGDPWAMMSGPMNALYDKQSVYFFNLNDLEKIDRSKFSNIYFIIPNDNLDFYKQNDFIYKLSLVKNYAIKKESLNISTGSKNIFYSQIPTPPIYQETYVYGKIYLLK